MSSRSETRSVWVCVEWLKHFITYESKKGPLDDDMNCQLQSFQAL